MEEKNSKDDNSECHCNICCETFTSKARKPFSCPRCEYQVCMQCVRQYILTTSTTQPVCINPECKTQWSNDVLRSQLPQTFLNKEYKKHREQVLYETHVCTLPSVQHLAKIRLALEETMVTKKKLNAKLNELHAKVSHLNAYKNCLRKENIYRDLKQLQISCSKPTWHRSRKLIKWYYLSTANLFAEFVKVYNNEYVDSKNYYNLVQDENWEKISPFPYHLFTKENVEKLYATGNKFKKLPSRYSVYYPRRIPYSLLKDFSEEHYKRLIATLKNVDLEGLEQKVTYALAELYKKIKETSTTYHNVCEQARVYQNADETFQPNTQTHRARTVSLKCPVPDCKGFLKSDWHCGICDCYVCSKCHEKRGEEGGAEETHVCKPENIESAKMIMKECKPCPSCSSMIYKIIGCDQMWCTLCKTPFSWRTGKIIHTGVLHNPHYMEYQREVTGNANQRDLNDIPCGGMPDYREITGLTKHIYQNETALNILYWFHLILDVENDKLPRYTNEANDTQRAIRELQIKYLLNRLDDDGFKKGLQKLEKHTHKKEEMRMILETMRNVGADTFRTFILNISDVMKKEVYKDMKENPIWQEWVDEYAAVLEILYNINNVILNNQPNTRSALYRRFDRMSRTDETIDRVVNMKMSALEENDVNDTLYALQSGMKKLGSRYQYVIRDYEECMKKGIGTTVTQLNDIIPINNLKERFRNLDTKMTKKATSDIYAKIREVSMPIYDTLDKQLQHLVTYINTCFENQGKKYKSVVKEFTRTNIHNRQNVGLGTWVLRTKPTKK